jgi:hypothetical protein
MTPAQLIMLGLGLAALAGGIFMLMASRRGTDAQRYARRMMGTMLAALGGALTVFALGLAGKLETVK